MHSILIRFWVSMVGSVNDECPSKYWMRPKRPLCRNKMMMMFITILARD